ncbi:hypothetical protein WMY93_029846 [Mugilogobius chulae]|uniref:Uncharacterized protein n=1 Tax=Mugilogobius chulae TaxID=88201 RepID=A0AAW0MQL8_9GOBI
MTTLKTSTILSLLLTYLSEIPTYCIFEDARSEDESESEEQEHEEDEEEEDEEEDEEGRKRKLKKKGIRREWSSSGSGG